LATLRLLSRVPPELAAVSRGVDDPAHLADLIGSLMVSTIAEKQSVLETFDLTARLDELLDLLARRIQVLEVSRDVVARTLETTRDLNPKHLLREQMRTVQKELGEGDESAAEIDGLDKAITDVHMSAEVDKVARKELKRLSRMSDASGESLTVRIYLEWLTELPWAGGVDFDSGLVPDPDMDIAEATCVLDQDHFGVEKVKKRILEYLAVRKLNPSGRSPILCFVGPPGVGGADGFHGHPASALLEVLDPELRGPVLPIGGVKEKVLAALRADLTTVMLPARNERDLEDTPRASACTAHLRLVEAGRRRDQSRRTRSFTGHIPTPKQPGV